MLVLSRKLNESIVIGGGINITIVGIGSHRVKIGIEAPPEVSIVRDELLARDDIHAQSDAADQGNNRSEDVPQAVPDPTLTPQSDAPVDMMAPGA